jgi:hypothetical protein
METLFWFWAKQYLLLHFNVVCSVFGVTDREDGTHDLRALDVSTLTISPTTQFYDGYENS